MLVMNRHGCTHTHTSPDPVGILQVAIYAQGVFHLNTWKMKLLYLLLYFGMKVNLGTIVAVRRTFISMPLCVNSRNKNDTWNILYSLLWFFHWCCWNSLVIVPMYVTTWENLLIILIIFFIIWLGLTVIPVSLMVLSQLQNLSMKLARDSGDLMLSCAKSDDISMFVPSLGIVKDKTLSRIVRLDH